MTLQIADQSEFAAVIVLVETDKVQWTSLSYTHFAIVLVEKDSRDLESTKVKHKVIRNCISTHQILSAHGSNKGETGEVGRVSVQDHSVSMIERLALFSVSKLECNVPLLRFQILTE